MLDARARYSVLKDRGTQEATTLGGGIAWFGWVHGHSKGAGMQCHRGAISDRHPLKTEDRIRISVSESTKTHLFYGNKLAGVIRVDQ